VPAKISIGAASTGWTTVSWPADAPRSGTLKLHGANKVRVRQVCAFAAAAPVAAPRPAAAAAAAAVEEPADVKEKATRQLVSSNNLALVLFDRLTAVVFGEFLPATDAAKPPAAQSAAGWRVFWNNVFNCLLCWFAWI
jgi:hypothetical protein